MGSRARCCLSSGGAGAGAGGGTGSLANEAAGFILHVNWGLGILRTLLLMTEAGGLGNGDELGTDGRSWTIQVHFDGDLAHMSERRTRQFRYG